MIATWIKNRGGSVGVIVDSNAVGASIQKSLKRLLPRLRIDRYHHGLRNEKLDKRQLMMELQSLNRESVKGQEFDSVFVLELNQYCFLGGLIQCGVCCT